MRRTYYRCSVCGELASAFDQSWEGDWLIVPVSGSTRGEMVIRCPEHITRYAIRKAGGSIEDGQGVVHSFRYPLAQRGTPRQSSLTAAPTPSPRTGVSSPPQARLRAIASRAGRSNDYGSTHGGNSMATKAADKLLKIRVGDVRRDFRMFFDWEDYDTLIGHTFYVVRREYQPGSSGLGTGYELREEPGRTNMSHEQRIVGWLGTTDNVYRYAMGRYEVVARKGGWLHLRDVTPEARTEETQ